MTTRQFAAKYGIKLRVQKKLTDLGRLIEIYMDHHKLSRQDFAVKAGITRQTLDGVMTGSKKFYDARVLSGIQRVLLGEQHE